MADAERLRLELQSVGQAREELLRAHRAEQASMDARYGELQGELRLKAVESDHFQAVAEETKTHAAQQRLENDILQKKIQVLNAGKSPCRHGRKALPAVYDLSQLAIVKSLLRCFFRASLSRDGVKKKDCGAGGASRRDSL